MPQLSPQALKEQKQVVQPITPLLDSPLPQNRFKYLSDLAENSAYQQILVQKNLPETLIQNAKIGIIEIPNSPEKNSGQNSLMGTNALLAATIRGIYESSSQKGTETKIALVAHPKIESNENLNLKAVGVNNLQKIMQEAFGSALDPKFNQTGNTVTFSLKGNTEKLIFTLEGIEGNPEALIILSHTDSKTHNLISKNALIQSAVGEGVRAELNNQVPIIGAQRIIPTDLKEPEKFKFLQDSFKQGFRFFAVEKDGKQIISIFQIDQLGHGVEQAKIEIALPTLATFKTFSASRAENLYQTLSKLITSNNNLSDLPLELKLSDKLITKVDKEKEPKLYKLISQGDLKLNEVITVPANSVGSGIEIHSYSLTYPLPNGLQTTQQLLIKSGQNYFQDLNAVIDDFEKGHPVGLVFTSNEYPYMISSTRRPQDFAQFLNARDVGYEIIDLGVAKDNKQIFGLKNMTTYFNEEQVGQKTKSYRRVSGLVDLNFKVNNSDDGGLNVALEQAVKADALAARKDDNPNVGARKTEYLTRRNTNLLIDKYIQTGDIESLTKNAAALMNPNNQESHRQLSTGMNYRFAEALGEILSRAALKRNMGQEFANKVRQADLPTLDALAILYLKAGSVIEGMNTPNTELIDAEKNKLEKWERFALAVAKTVIDKRDVNLKGAVVQTSGKVIGVIDGSVEFPEKSLIETYSKFGIKDIDIVKGETLVDKYRQSLEDVFESNIGKSLVYVWGHADGRGFTHIGTGLLAKNLLSSATKTVNTEGQIVVDLSKISFVFDGCYTGYVGQEFIKEIDKQARLSNIGIIAYPETYSAVNRNQLARFQHVEGVIFNGKKIEGTPLSLFQEALVNLEVSGREGLTREQMFAAAEYLSNYSKGRAKNFDFALYKNSSPHAKLDFAGQSPVVFDTQPLTIDALLGLVEKNINQNLMPGEGKLRLGRPAKENDDRFLLHLTSSNDLEFYSNS